MERAIPILPADDLVVAKAFYVDKLGFGVAFEVSDDGRSGILGLRRGTLSLTLDCPMEGHGRNACVSLEVDDADAYYREWSATVAMGRPPRDETWDARTFDLTDPFGNTIFVMGPRSGTHRRSRADLLAALFSELVHGSSDPKARTYILNQGDAGLLAALDRVSAAAASATHDGPSIAAHVDHLRYGLSILNRWAAGAFPPWPDTDWTASWRTNVVSDAEWRALVDDLRRESDAWRDALRLPREVSDVEAGWMTGSVAHLAYHMGAIRQIDRTTRGPRAEDEAQAQHERRGPTAEPDA